MSTYRTERDFQVALNRLNAMNDEWYRWSPTTARKEHVDAFGAANKDGETYYKMELGGSVTNHEKLSRASMETFLHLIFSGSPLLQKLSDGESGVASKHLQSAVHSLETTTKQAQTSSMED